MTHRSKVHNSLTALVPILICIVLVGVLVTGVQQASAQNCVAEASGFGVNQKGCTSQDVQIAGVQDICVLDQNGSCQALNTCRQGTDSNGKPLTVSFKANFKVQEQTSTTGGNQTRYDIGLYFANDGDPKGDGAFRGSCAVYAIGTRAGLGFINLDQDTCGDIDPAHNPLLVPLTITVPCVGTPDPNDQTKNILKLPACTTWKVPGGNTLCSANADGSNPTSAIASSTSKCKCQPGFTVPILVQTPEITVTKTARTASIPESQTTSVTYDVSVTNNGSINVFLQKLTDSLYGDITKTSHNGITGTTCAVPTTIPPGIVTGNPYTCNFTVSVTAGNVSSSDIIDTVCAGGTDSQGDTVGGDTQTDPPSSFCGTATVTISNVPTSATLAKTVDSADVTYRVVVTNTSAVDALSLTRLCDDKFGDISGNGGSNPACPAATQTLVSTKCPSLPMGLDPAGGNIECTFVGRITSTQTDTVTGKLVGSDASDNPLTPSDSATVSITQ